jgi:succinate dehydrogenase / fumarate reductase, iron-sulfur subunit
MQRHFRVWRGDSTGGGILDYDVEVNDGEVVLDVIHRLQATQTPDLACRWNCKAGKCGSCSMEINGKPRLSCMTRMSTFEETETVTITPLRTFPVIRDLVTDVSFNYEKARETPAFAPPSGLRPGDYRMKQIDVERSQEFRKCIECYLCQNTCHVVRDHDENKESFSGPRFFIRAAELDMHPLDDRADRKEHAQASQGLGYCNITKCCTEVCPEHIKITDNAIIPMKERVVDRRYDPLVWLGRKIFRRDQLEEQPATANLGHGGIPRKGVSGNALADPLPPDRAPSTPRAPEGPPVNFDGRMDVAEAASQRAGGLSPFGEDQQFPLQDITYRPPEKDEH